VRKVDLWVLYWVAMLEYLLAAAWAALMAALTVDPSDGLLAAASGNRKAEMKVAATAAHLVAN
jgi:nitrous oxidase accessory protein NosD